MKTKFLALLIALMVMPFLSACGDDDDSINPNKFGTASLQSSQWTGTLTKKYDVGTVQKDRVANCGIILTANAAASSAASGPTPTKKWKK